MSEKETSEKNSFSTIPATVTKTELEDLGGESLDGSGFEGETPDWRFA